MTKTAPIAFRVEPDVKAALERAAKDDQRSVSSLVQKLLVDHLRQNGYLQDPPRPD